MMKPSVVSRTLLLTAVLTTACDDEPLTAGRPKFGQDAGAEGGDGGDVDARRGPQFAVVSSDYTATAISLLDVNAEVVADNYLNSGSTEAGLVTALSGDVALPTRSGERGVMVLVDRFKTDVITRVRLDDGEILGQVQTHTPDEQDSDDAFTSNPHDYLRIDADTAWVTRNQPNLDPKAAEIDLGDDLIRIDPSAMERTDERIDLSALRAEASRTDPESGETDTVELYARPSRLVRIGDTLVVGLGLNAYDFSAVGPGTIALVDLASREVDGFELEGLKGCSDVSPVPGTTDRVLVGCRGDYSEPGKFEGAALVRIRGGEAELEKSWRLEDHGDGPALANWFVAIDARTITAAANAYADDTSESVFGTIDLDSGEFTRLLSIAAGEGFFGLPHYDAETERLFVPDDSADADMRPTAGVHVLTRTADGFEAGALVRVAEDTGMPARAVFAL